MVIVTKDRGPLQAKCITFTPDGSHDMVILWRDGSYEHMRKAEIKAIVELDEDGNII